MILVGELLLSYVRIIIYLISSRCIIIIIIILTNVHRKQHFNIIIISGRPTDQTNWNGRGTKLRISNGFLGLQSLLRGQSIYVCILFRRRQIAETS